MNAPNPHQFALLGEAIPHLRDKDYAPYLRLKRLIAERPKGFRPEFRKTFESYYGLNAGGVTEAFKDRYFDLLFGLKLRDGVDPYAPLLRELHAFPRRRGDRALPCSFVSKLVAMHDETRPIYDRHVGDFFGIKVPSAGGVEFRIAGFVANLEALRSTYARWAEDKRFSRVLATVKLAHPALAACAGARVADLLVWTVGRRKLGRTAAEGGAE